MTLEVTDHAVLRYLERAYGVDTDRLRARIGRRLNGRVAEALAGLSGPPPQEFAVCHDGLRYRCRTDPDGSVHVTSVTAGQKRDGDISKRAVRLRRRLARRVCA